MEEEINMLDEIEEIRLIKEDDDETFDLWLPGKVEDLIKCLLEENDFVVEDNDVTTFDLRLDKAKHNLDNAKQQMELMVEENKSLKATIENKNKHILETENKAAKDAKAAFVLYTNSNNQLKDVIHQANKNHVKMQMEKDQLQEQLQKLTKIKNAEAKDQRKMIDHLKKKMAEVENENNKNAKTAERSHRRKNECKQQLKATLMQSEKERITSQRTIANLQNNIRTLSEELKESKKSVTNSEAEKIVSQRTITELQTKIRNLFKELNDLKTRFLSVTDKLQGAEQRVIDLTKTIDYQNQDKVTACEKLDKLEKENEYLVNQLRSNKAKIELLHTSHETERNKHKSAMKRCTHLQNVVKDVQKLNREKIQLETDNISQRQDNETLNSRLEMLNVEKLEIEDRLRLKDNEVEVLFNSLKTERQEHESAMKKLEMLYVAVQNECVELLLKLQKIHNSSEISFEKLNSVIDKDIFGQKLEETTAQENTLAKDTTKILENFASVKDKKGCIEVLKKRFEKSLPKCDNGISSAEKTDMEDNTSNSSCTKYYEETVMESQATCHNRIHRTTNVTNFNIAGSNVSFNENTQQLSRLNGNNGQFPAIEEGN